MSTATAPVATGDTIRQADTLANPLLFSTMYPMENDIKKYIEEHTEKLAAMVAEGFASTATKDDLVQLKDELKHDIVHLEVKMDAGFAKRLQEHDELRDRMRLLETRVDNLEAVRR